MKRTGTKVRKEPEDEWKHVDGEKGKAEFVVALPEFCGGTRVWQLCGGKDLIVIGTLGVRCGGTFTRMVPFVRK